MADTKITALTAITTVDPAVDVLPIVDISDTTMAASGTTKKITSNQILGAGGTATLASATITGNLTVDTNTLFVDSANNRVGIGTASPAAPVDVQGSSLRLQLQSSSNGGYATWKYIGKNSSGTAVNFEQGLNIAADNAFELYDNQNTQLVSRYVSGVSGAHSWFLTGSTAMTLNSSGLGVGVTPSTAWNTGGNLQVGVFAGLYTNSSLGAVDLTSNSIRTGSDTYQYLSSSSNNASRFQQRDGSFRWFNAPAGTSPNAITFTQAMTLDASGNLLVGTTTAGGRLDVQTATGDCAARIKSNAAGSNATLAIDYVNSYGTQVIRKSGTDVWLSGVIADTGATPNYKIQNGSAVGVQLVSGATAWTTLSDETVKDIIEPITNAITKVGSLRSVIGKFKTDSEGTRRSFLIAQDVKSVLPEAVDVVGENNELGLRYTEVIPLLVAAIKELTARVEALEA
jgi:hypothetical protein